MSVHKPNHFRGQEFLLCLAIVLLGFIYIYRIGDKALDFDERYSMNIATGIGGATSEYREFGRFIVNPISGKTFTAAQYKERYNLRNVISTAMNDNGQGLPYFVTLHGWLRLFGVSVFNARVLSALVMLMGLVLMYTVLLRWGFTSDIALFTVVLFGCNGVVVGLAQYVRFYSLGVLLTLMSCHLVYDLRSKPIATWRGFLLGLLWSIMFLNQFFSLFIIAAEAIYLAWTAERAKLFRITLPALAGALLVFFVWLVPMHGWESLRNVYTLNRSVRLGIPELTTRSGFCNTTIGLLATLAGAFGQPVSAIHTGRSLLLQMLIGLPALLLIVLVIWKQKRTTSSETELCLLVLMIYSVASIIHAALTHFNLLFQGRYWLFAYIFSYTLLAGVLTPGLKEKGPLRWLAITVLTLTCGRAIYTSVSVMSGLSLSADGKLVPVHIQPYEDYEGVAATLMHIVRSNDTVSYNSWMLAQRVNWFLLKAPQLTQRVDTTQNAPVLICDGLKRREVPISLGRTTTARPVWLMNAGD